MLPPGRLGCLVTIILIMAAPAAAQPPAPAVDNEQAAAQPPAEETVDIFDLLRKLRHKDTAAQTKTWDYRKPMIAFAPVIGAKPSSGVLFGAAGNVAFYRGDPSTTRISSLVTSLTFSTKKQTSMTNRFTMFGRTIAGATRGTIASSGPRSRRTGSARAQTPARACRPTSTSSGSTRLPTIDCVRLCTPARDCISTTTPTSAPATGKNPAWTESPYVEYSEAHGLPLDSQTAAGTSLDLLWDNRDSFINADHGWLAKASYRTLFDGFLGGDSSWQKLNLDRPNLREPLA